MRISVIVPTYARPELLERCLTVLASQVFDPQKYDIWIADNAGTGTTRRQVEDWAARCPFPRIHYVAAAERPGPAAARNTGWRAAGGEIIAFTDDDTVPSPGWLPAGAAALDNHRAAAVSGAVIVPLRAHPTDYERNEAGLSTAEFVTANCFIRRSVLDDLGGFDERFCMAWREDSDLHFRLLKAGYPIHPAPDAWVMHPVRPARWGISLAQQQKSQYDALLFKKHPDWYRCRIRPGVPLHYYVIAGSALGTLAMLLARQPGEALICGVAWAASTAAFAAKRLRGASFAPSHVAELLVTSALIPFLSIYWRLRGAVRFRTLFL